jgi:hypothetical protein
MMWISRGPCAIMSGPGQRRRQLTASPRDRVPIRGRTACGRFLRAQRSVVWGFCMKTSVASRALAWRHALVLVSAVLGGGACSDIEPESSRAGQPDPLLEARARDRQAGLLEGELPEPTARTAAAAASCSGSNGGWDHCDEDCPCAAGHGDCDGHRLAGVMEPERARGRSATTMEGRP